MLPVSCDHVADCSSDYEEWIDLTEHIKDKFPLAEKQFVKM